MPALAERTLDWRTHRIGGGYVRTAVCADGSLLVESYLADKAHKGTPQRHFRAVCIPAALARAVVAGVAADLAGDENGETR